MKNTEYDSSYIRSKVQKFLKGYHGNNMSKFVKTHGEIVFEEMVKKVHINCNIFNASGTGSNWWKYGYDMRFSFRQPTTEISVIINKKGYYELVVYVFKPSSHVSKVYLPQQLDQLLEDLEKEISAHRITMEFIKKAISIYAMFKKKHSVEHFVQHVEVLKEHGEIIGMKESLNRLNNYEYMPIEMKTVFNEYKVGVTFKNNNNVVFLMAKEKPAKTVADVNDKNYINMAFDTFYVELLNDSIRYVEKHESVTDLGDAINFLKTNLPMHRRVGNLIDAL